MKRRREKEKEHFESGELRNFHHLEEEIITREWKSS